MVVTNLMHSRKILSLIVSARTTPQYNPVCGTDGVNYHNEARLDCARECGVGKCFFRCSLSNGKD